MAELRGNLVFLGLIQVFRLAAGVAVNVMIMQVLGVEGYGVYGYVLTLVGLLSFGANMGMSRYLQREIARAPERAGRLVTTGFVAALLLSLITAGVIVTWATLRDGRPEVVGAAALGSVALGLQALVQPPVAWFNGTRRMKLALPGALFGRILLVVGTAAALWTDHGVMGVFAAQVVDALAGLAISAVIALRGVEGPGTSVAEVRELVRSCLPFGLNALFGSIYLSVDVLVLQEVCGDREVGIYRGAVMLISLFPIVADSFTTGIYPRMALHLGDPERAGAELRFVSRVLLALSVPAAVGGLLVAEPLMVFIGGEPFSVSALPFMVLAPMLPLRFLNNGTAMTLSALDRQPDRTRGVFVAALLNLAANLVVVPHYGAVGAAATTLGTEVMLTFWFRWHVRGLAVGVGLLDSLWRVALPALAMGAVVWLLDSWHVVLVVLCGALVYGALALLTRGIQRADLRRLAKV